ncbi:MAG: squalene/phytoene synthase family protein [Gemmatimonadetes bacterium]|nr:squalene/phytoene synthase family protein [Gemmatimonadota bacterium]
MSEPTLNELLHAASRTFALGIDLLPEPLRSEIEVAYLVLRVSDYLEDNETMPAERKVPLLRAWSHALRSGTAPGDLLPTLTAVTDDTPDALVARNTARVLAAVMALRPAAREIIVRHTADSTDGMARWVERGPEIPDEDALDDYMHEVAGRVGWLLTDLFALEIPSVARHHEALSSLGREFGLALQTVNVIRGLHGDWERGWVFVPETFVPRGSPDPVALLDGSVSDPVHERAILDRLVDKAERHLEAARHYLAGLPRRRHGIRLFCLLPYLFAVRTLAISRSNPRVFREETKIGRSDVRAIVRDARLLGWSNAWIRWYGERLRTTAVAG